MGPSVNATPMTFGSLSRIHPYCSLLFVPIFFFLIRPAPSTLRKIAGSGFPLASHPLLSLIAALLAPPGVFPSVSPNYLFVFLMKTSNFGGVMCFINLTTATNDEIWANSLKYI